MADLTADRKATDRFNPEDTVLPNLIAVPIYTLLKVYAGTMGMVASHGYATSVTAATNRIIGRVEKSVDNSAGSSGDKSVDVRPGAFYWDNSAGAACTQAYMYKPVYAEDNHTVRNSSSSGTYAYAGIMVGLRADGQVAVQMGYADPYALTDYSMPRYQVRGSCITNHSLSAFTVATNTDGITYVAGDIVLLVGQTAAAENGPYVVGTVATTAPLTRPTWWATGAYVPMGTVFECGGEGTLRGGMSYKSFVITATVVIGTTTPLLYPQFVMGKLTIGTGAATTGATISVTTQAFAVLTDITTANKMPTQTLTAGADQTGTLALANGNGTDDINYVVVNW
jgi:hypothetical protein